MIGGICGLVLVAYIGVAGVDALAASIVPAVPVLVNDESSNLVQ